MSKYIPLSKPFITSIEKNFAKNAIDSTWISSRGSYITEFENNFSKKFKNFAHVFLFQMELLPLN